jgi:hypothetical protein
MKRKAFVFCLLAIVLTSCDPGFIIEYKISNQSGHRVTFTSNNKNEYSIWNEHPDGIILEQGNDSVFLVYDGLGMAELDLAQYILLQYVYGDTLSFSFDDGKRLVYTSETVTGPYDFDGDHFEWTTEKASWPFHHDAYGCLTYTITEEDYLKAE